MYNVVEGEPWIAENSLASGIPLRCTGPNGGKRSEMAIDLEGGEKLVYTLIVKGYLVVELVFL